MREAHKTNLHRPADFADRYLAGRVLDIGAGGDKVCRWAEEFDKAQGDANHVERYFAPETFDTVHSSHCLEHMIDPVGAIRGWWALVKPGGHMVVVVPDEDLYEQGMWPSRFNRDHKHTFRLGKDRSWSPVSLDIRALCETLEHSQLVSAQIQDNGYDHSLLVPEGVPKTLRKPFHLRMALSIAKRVPFTHGRLRVRLQNWLTRFGYVVDQTQRDALAQIQVIVRKAATTHSA